MSCPRRCVASSVIASPLHLPLRSSQYCFDCAAKSRSIKRLSQAGICTPIKPRSLAHWVMFSSVLKGGISCAYCAKNSAGPLICDTRAYLSTTKQKHFSYQEATGRSHSVIDHYILIGDEANHASHFRRSRRLESGTRSWFVVHFS